MEKICGKGGDGRELRESWTQCSEAPPHTAQAHERLVCAERQSTPRLTATSRRENLTHYSRFQRESHSRV